MYQARQIGKILYGFPCHNKSNEDEKQINNRILNRILQIGIRVNETFLPNDSNQILAEIGVMLHNDGEYNGPQFVYIIFQKLMYQSVYGDCIYSNTIEDIVAPISFKYKQKFSQKLLKNIELYNYWSANQ